MLTEAGEVLFKDYHTLSAEVKAQIQKTADIWQAHLGDRLTGIYLHGSISLGCFVEGVSDIDMLIVTSRRIAREERLSLAEDILKVDFCPSPLEMSAMWEDDLSPWKYPTPCQFHYSDTWTERYRLMLSGELRENFIVDTDFTDKDIACHVALTNQCGVCVCGRPIREVFPPVPEADFWDSISADIDLDFHAYSPRYFASNILLLGRVLSYKKEKRILSKYEGGVWTREHVPEQHRGIVDNALSSWYFGEKLIQWKPEELEGLHRYLVGEIRTN